MLNTMNLNILKQYKTNSSPFSTVIYIINDKNKILIEDLKTGKSEILDSYRISDYISIRTTKTPFIKIFDDLYIAVDKNSKLMFFRINNETPFQTIINCNSRNLPYMKLKHPSRILNYKHFKNLKEMKNEKNTFSIKFSEASSLEILTDDNNYIDFHYPIITCKLPFFKTYFLTEVYKQMKIFIKIADTYYRFPYGNVNQNDTMCIRFHGEFYNYFKNINILKEYYMSNLLVSPFNGDMEPFINHNRKTEISLDLKSVQNKINNNNFNISFIDVLYYLSECESEEDVNPNLFIKTPNIPEEILNDKEF